MAVRFLRGLAGWVTRYPQFFIYPQILLFGFCVFYTIQNLEFDTSRNNLVGSEKRYHQNFLQFREEFPAQDDLVVVVESESPEKNRQFVERLGVKLERETNIFTDVFYKGDLQMMGSKALLFVPEEDLKELQKTLENYRPFLQQFTRATNLVSLFTQINRQFRTAKAEQTAETEALIEAIPALERIVVQATGGMERPGVPPSPGVNALFGATGEAEQEMYITFAGGQIYLVTARAREEHLNSAAVDRLRELVRETETEVAGLNVGVTGEPVLEVDEMAQSQKDTTFASVIALMGCALIFIFGYRQVGRPLKATLALVVGLGYTMAYTTLVVGHLNILTITFVPILIGLAIDFGVHLITRFEEELRVRGRSEEAIRIAMVNTGLGIFTGAFTTSGAFLAMGLTSFKGIQEMGIICGGGMLLCLISMMTLLPALLLQGGQKPAEKRGESHPTLRARLEQRWLQRPGLVASVTVCLAIIAAVQARKLYFDYNLLNMQSKDLPAVIFEKKLIDSASKSVLFAAVVADSEEEALALEKQILALPSVASVESMARYLAADQTDKLGLINNIKQTVAPLTFPEIDPAPVDIPELSRTLWALQGYLGLAAKATHEEEPKLAAQLRSLRDSIIRCRRVMLEKEQLASTRLMQFQQALFEDIHDTFFVLRHQDTRDGLRIKDLPEALRNRFIGVNAKYLLQVYPKDDIWQRENQEEFIFELRDALDPKDTGTPIITGTPVQLYEYTTLLKDSYQQAAWYALGAIAILVLIHFRSVTCVFLALVPVGLGMLFLAGLMGFFGIPFNPANIMTLPLVIGIGVTNGIHILNRFSEEQDPGILSKSTGKAVLVSGLTTITGFGSLTFAEHQGIASLGLMMSIGVATCMVVGLAFLPALLTLLISKGWKIKKPSVDMHTPTLGPEEPR
ncbi:MAG: MMPL family transporter [Verrucomicrobia bacterium]|nr:MMPL family transporter [Verrucomicrobiota bacterium]